MGSEQNTDRPPTKPNIFQIGESMAK